MEIVIVLAIAGIAIFLVSQGSGVAIKGNLTAYATPPVASSYPEFQPSPSPQVNSSAYVSTGLNAGANFASGAISAGAVTAAGAATAGIGAAVAIAGQLLAQHQARLKGATNENNAALAIVPAYDDFVARLLAAYRTGQISPQQTAAALQSFDQSIYNQLRGLVGPPGTAWSDSAGMAGRCDKSCTVGCCLYYSDLGPPLSLMRYVLGDRSGQWGANDPRLSGRTVTVPKVYPGKYSSFSRASYTVQL